MVSMDYGGPSMPLVRVKEKYQVTLPASVRKKLGLAVGDVLEATVEDNKITLTPKSVIDRELAEALQDFQEGRFIGPFENAKDAIDALRRTTP
jgi:AbrB family looped-hinge helix DNA binding protein